LKILLAAALLCLGVLVFEYAVDRDQQQFRAAKTNASVNALMIPEDLAFAAISVCNIPITTPEQDKRRHHKARQR
jgi:hypothetical protein